MLILSKTTAQPGEGPRRAGRLPLLNPGHSKRDIRHGNRDTHRPQALLLGPQALLLTLVARDHSGPITNYCAVIVIVMLVIVFGSQFGSQSLCNW